METIKVFEPSNSKSNPKVISGLQYTEEFKYRCKELYNMTDNELKLRQINSLLDSIVKEYTVLCKRFDIESNFSKDKLGLTTLQLISMKSQVKREMS